MFILTAVRARLILKEAQEDSRVSCLARFIYLISWLYLSSISVWGLLHEPQLIQALVSQVLGLQGVVYELGQGIFPDHHCL